MKKLLVSFVLYIPLVLSAQAIHNYPTADGDNTYAGVQTYNQVVNNNALVQNALTNQYGTTPTLQGGASFGPVAHAFFSSVYTTPLPTGNAFVGFGISALHLDGGSNFNQNGLSYKPGLTSFKIISQSNTPGSVNPIAITNYQYGLGDTFGIFNLAYCYGGTSAGGDEGCENNDEWTFQGIVDYEGAITRGQGLGSTSITVNSLQGEGTQGGGRYLHNLNAARLITGGTISNITGTATYKTYTGNGTSWPIGTVNTTLGTNITSIGVSTVTPGSMSGITTSTVLCIADSGAYETLIPSAITGTTFTATFRKPHTSASIVAAGGLCGYSVGINTDAQAGTGITGTLLVTYPVIRSTSATSMDVWIAGAGSYVGYPGTWSLTNNGYTLYPSAEIVSVNNGTQNITDTLTLAPNTVFWQTGDTVDLPVYPYIAQQNGNNWVTRNFAGGQSVGRTFNFGPYWATTAGIGGAGGGASLFIANNNTTSTYYSAANNRYPPYGIIYNGIWDDIVKMSNAPATAAIYVGGCGASGCGAMNFLESNTGNGTDYLQYNQLNGLWTLSAGFQGGSWSFNAGTFNYSNAVSLGTTSGHITTLNGTQINIASGQIGAPAGVDIYIEPNTAQQLNLIVPTRQMNISAGGGINVTSKVNFGSTGQTVLDANGVKHEGGSAPSISGTGATLSHGTNAGGIITLSSATTATITFANSGFTTWAACSGNLSVSGTVWVSAQSATACTFTFNAATTGSLNYHVDGN